MRNVAPNPSIRELSLWLRVSRWHELVVNHIIPAGTSLDRIKRASVLLNPIGGESNLDHLPSMVRVYLDNAQAMIGCVPYHLRRLVVSVEDSPLATVGLNQLWVPSIISKYCMLTTKLLITMVRSRDIAPVDDEPFVNVLGDLHSDLGDALENLISYIRSRQDADRDDEDLVPIHTLLKWGIFTNLKKHRLYFLKFKKLFFVSKLSLMMPKLVVNLLVIS
jgi:hypothetical protein